MTYALSVKRRLAAVALVAATVLAGCGSSKPMTAKQAVAQVQGDIRAVHLTSDTGMDAELAGLEALARRMFRQSWPSYAQTDVADIVARSKTASQHVAADDLGSATVDLTELNADITALAATLKAHGG